MKIRWFLSALVVVSAGSAVVASECRPIDGIQSLLKPGKVVMLGELHGTREAPAFALDVACHAAAAKLPVVVALELSTAEQQRVDAFLDSEGSEADGRKLISGSIWQREYQDGRNSRAMADLIEGVRELRSPAASVRVALFDASGSKGGQHRDHAMGRNLARIAGETTEALLIVLTGNMHSRITKGRARNANYEPMGYVLAQSIPAERLVSLNMAHGGGSAWLCAPDCGVVGISGKHGQRRWAIEIDDATRAAGHHGWYHVGEINASLPARIAATPEPLESSVAEGKSAPKADDPIAAGRVTVKGKPAGPLSEAETKFQGRWRAYDYASDSTTWKIDIDGRSFRAQGGPDDWYEGWVGISKGKQPAQIDFVIEDCRCSFKGDRSAGIFTWDGETIVIAAPRPGDNRPAGFNRNSGEMMRLRPLK